jgi:HK97 gp10 family phage protein
MIRARLIKNRLPELPREIRQAATSVINAHAQNVASLARALAPVRTGRLRASIAVEVSGTGAVSVIADAPYAVYVELGTSRQSPQPFLRPAVENDRPGLMSDLQKVIR